MEKNVIDPNNPNQTPREQEGLGPNMANQKAGQPSAFAGMDTGTVNPDTPVAPEQDAPINTGNSEGEASVH